MFKKFIVSVVAASLISYAVPSFAAFGSKASSSKSYGVSRSMSRPKATTPRVVPKTYSKPSSSYSKPSSSYGSKPRYYGGNPNNQFDNYDRGRYNNNGYGNGYPQQPSAMRDIGVGVASVAGGILAAEAIKGLIAGPNGTYTHPSYPNQYFNAGGVPVDANGQVLNGTSPNEQSGNVAQGNVPPTVVYVENPRSSQQQNDSGLFPFWGFVGGLLEFLLVMAILAGLAFGGWKLFGIGKRKLKEEKQNMMYDLDDELSDIDSVAQEIFFNFQKNSDNIPWLKANTKYLNVEDCVSNPSTVVSYEHRTIDCAVEQGKLRASVEYKAVVKNDECEESVHQIWNVEKHDGKWFVIGVESV